ncbi:MAG TPA: DUF2243 domain-containing protein [Solirubrobacteraceae bacterium]|nr:DUF2243 domain-containing protein [Solirubrobacteraceae bacterium]
MPVTAPASAATTAGPPKAAGLVTGVGLGGFVDGILFHQIFQWHHMLTDTGAYPAGMLAGLETNTLVDGFFHAATWLLVVGGMLLTVRAWQRGELAPPWRAHVGMLLTGWGAFNLVEGVVDHHILTLHHVRDDLGAPLGWDLAFLALGGVLVVVGLGLARSGERTARARDAGRAARAAAA